MNTFIPQMLFKALNVLQAHKKSVFIKLFLNLLEKLCNKNGECWKSNKWVSQAVEILLDMHDVMSDLLLAKVSKLIIKEFTDGFYLSGRHGKSALNLSY